MWSVAAESACPWPAGTFLTAYEQNRQDAIASTLDGDVLVEQVRAVAPWTGTATDLLSELANRPATLCGPQASFRGPRELSNALRRLSPALRKVGVDVTFSKEGHTRRRLITLTPTGDVADSGIAGIAAPHPASPVPLVFPAAGIPGIARIPHLSSIHAKGKG